MWYALLGQDSDGLQWLGNFRTLDKVRADYNQRDDHRRYDAFLVVPLAAFADLDGYKPERAPLVLMAED